MIKRNLASILIIASCVLSIVNIDFSNISKPKEYWSLALSLFFLLASIVLIFKIESKIKKKNLK